MPPAQSGQGLVALPGLRPLEALLLISACCPGMTGGLASVAVDKPPVVLEAISVICIRALNPSFSLPSSFSFSSSPFSALLLLKRDADSFQHHHRRME